MLVLTNKNQVIFLNVIMLRDSFQSDIEVKLAAPSCVPYLPENLEIRILDEQRETVMQAQSRQLTMLQMHFQGIVGEQFSIELELNDINLVETFVI